MSIRASSLALSSALALALALAACSDPRRGGDASPDAPADAPPDRAPVPDVHPTPDADDASLDAPPACRDGETLCGGRCVDTRESRAHCGSCGTTCAAGHVCVMGACEVSCPVLQTACAGACVSTATDRAHCGACDRACAAGEVCTGGRCEVACGPGLATCGAGDGGAIDAGGGSGRYCADTRVDRRNCGACGAACPAGHACDDGRCALACPAGQTACAGACADTQTDRAHCGACGAACPAGAVCSAGRCEVSCGAGLADCMGSCRDVQTDRAHCGACARACAAGEVCVAGACALSCPAGQTACGARCADLASDRANCGTCGASCPSGICAGGRCTDPGDGGGAACLPPRELCAGACTSTATDPGNCGACGAACPAPAGAAAACAAGRCGFVCDAGRGDCDGRPTNGCEADTTRDVAHCGACGAPCAARANATVSCAAGRCGFACSAGFADCDADAATGCEADTRSSVAHCGACGRACPSGQACVASACAAITSWTWHAGDAGLDAAYRIARDAAGNYYVTGQFEDTVNFGAGFTRTAAGDADVFVLSLSSAGMVRWVRTYGTPFRDIGLAIATDPAGNVYVTGGVSGVVDFGGGPRGTPTGDNAFVLSLTSSGAHRWSRVVGGGGGDTATGVAVGGAGNVVVSGWFTGTADFGGGAVASAGSEDAFVASYDAAGTFRWARRYGAALVDFANGVAVDAAGVARAAVVYEGTVDFGGGAVRGAGLRDVAVVALDDAGAFRWATAFGGPDDDVAYGIALDSAGDANVVGDFDTAMTFGGMTVTSNGWIDAFAVSIGPTGTPRWARAFGGADDDAGNGVATDAAGNVYVTGAFRATGSFGATRLTSAGSSDAFLVSLDFMGAQRSARRYGAIGADSGFAVVADGAAVVLGGIFRGTVDFGSGPVTSNDWDDAFVARIP